MRGGGSAGDAVDVELDEGPRDRVANGPRDPRRARRRSFWIVAAVLVVAAAVGVTSAVMTAEDQRRERDRRDALADVPGLLPPLDGPLTEAWTVPDARLAAVGRDVVVLDAPRGVRLTGVDLRTGGQAWTRRVADDEVCTTLGAESTLVRPGTGSGPDELLACHRFFATVEGSRVAVGDPASVAVLDVATGTQVATVPTPADVLGAVLAGDDVVVASLDEAGAVVVARWALPGSPDGSARQIWSRRLPEPLERMDRGGWVFRVEADLVRVGTVGSAPLDLVTGEPRPGAARDGVLYTMQAPLPGGARVEWDVDGAARVTGESRLVPAEGGDVVELDGVPWRADVSDDSVPGVLLLRRGSSLFDTLYDTASGTGGVVAVDTASGVDLWSGGRMAGMVALVQLDGILVTAGAGKVVAVDVRDGDVVWQDTAGGVGTRPNGLTDGAVVVLSQGAGAEVALVARDLRTGVERWQVPLHDDGGYLSLVGTGAGVLVLSDAGVSLLTP